MPEIEALVGWYAAGSAPGNYRFGVDREVAHQGSGSGFVWSRTDRVDDGFGTLMQTFTADDYRGSRRRLSAWVRVEGVTSWAGLWMRVDGPGSDGVLAFDNMQDRPITGTADWRSYHVVLDVGDDARRIAFGVLLAGPGRAWIDDVAFERVDDTVAPTGGPQLRDVPGSPSNLDFEERP